MSTKPLALLLLAAAASLGSCTTRYQDLLHDRDSRIRELSGTIANLRSENEELQRREAQARADLEKSRSDGPGTAAPADAGAASRLQSEIPEATIGYSRGRLSIGIPDSVTFDSGSTVIRDSARGVLGQVANVLRRDHTGKRIYIEGHTDTDPIEKTKDKFSSNRHLSVMRADAVARELIRLGVPESTIVVAGYGQFDPKDRGTKARNRRVEICVGEGM